MLVRLSEISPGGSYFEIHKIEGLESPSFDVAVVPGSINAQCTLKRKGENKAELQGQLAAILRLDCDRCLVTYELKVNTALQLLFEVETEASWRLKDLEYKIPDLDTIVLDEPVIDLDDVIRQQLLLALPMKKLCSENCRGICARCGSNLNQVVCGCDGEQQESPFVILAQLKKQN